MGRSPVWGGFAEIHRKGSHVGRINPRKKRRDVCATRACGEVAAGQRPDGVRMFLAGRKRHVDHERVVIDPEVLCGKPIIKGTRLAVEFIVDLLAQGWSEADILKNYPGITHEDLLACLAYASAVLRAEKVYPVGGVR